MAILLAASASLAAQAEPEPLSPRQVLKMPEAVAVTSGPQVVRGIVTFVSGIESNRFVIAPQESPSWAGLPVRLLSGGEMPMPGDLVLVRGALVWGDGLPTVRADAVDVILNGTLDEARSAKQADYRKGILVNRRVRLLGTVREVCPHPEGPVPVTDLILRIDNYVTRVRVPGLLEAKDYLDEPISIEGLVRNRSNEKGEFLDAWLEVSDPGEIHLLRGERLSRFVLVCSALVGCLLLLAAGFFLVLWVRGRRARRELEVVAAERRRMAADLHDTIEQHLAGANLIVAGVLSLGDVPPDVREAMNTLTALLANAKAEVRSAVLSLRTAGDSRRTLSQVIEGMVPALEKTGIRARRCLRGLPDSLPEGVSHDIELILREATTNAVKHGKAKHVVFTADPRGERGFVLRVLNDGEPFDITRALGPEMGHYGISGMKERALRNRLAISWGMDRDWTYMELVSEGL